MGSQFNELAFLIGESGRLVAKCKSFTKVYEIKREDFLSLLLEN